MNLARVVVGTDGSPGAAAALAFAASLAGATGAEVVVVHARGLLDRLESAGEGPGGPPPGALEPGGAPCRWVVRDGNPVEVLLAVAEEEGAGAIVVGRRGLGAYPEQLLGSTSAQVAQRATRPVVIVPPGP